jgi:hypothetical protein
VGDEMSHVKDAYMELHEKKIAEYLDKHLNATDQEAYENTSDAAYDDLGDYMADKADAAYQQEKDRRLDESNE